VRNNCSTYAARHGCSPCSAYTTTHAAPPSGGRGAAGRRRRQLARRRAGRCSGGTRLRANQTAHPRATPRACFMPSCPTNSLTLCGGTTFGKREGSPTSCPPPPSTIQTPRRAGEGGHPPFSSSCLLCCLLCLLWVPPLLPPTFKQVIPLLSAPTRTRAIRAPPPAMTERRHACRRARRA